MFVAGNYSVDPSFGVQRLSVDESEGMTGFSPVTKEVAKSAFLHNPSASLAQLIGSGVGDADDNEARFTQEDISKKRESEFYAKFIDIGKGTITESEYKKLYSQKQAEQIRLNIMSRAPDTFIQGAKNFGVSLMVGMIDPINIAVGFLPGGLAARGALGAPLQTAVRQNAQRIAQSSSMLGRTAARAESGAVAGFVETAITEPFVYAAAQQRQEKYDYTDVLTSLMFGSVVGAGIHATGGALYDVATLPGAAKRRAREEYKKGIEADRKKKADDLEMSQNEMAQLIQRTYTNADQYSVSQRDLASFSKKDRSDIMQVNLASFIEGKKVNPAPLIDTIKQKVWAEKYRPEDVGKIYADVMQEHLDLELDIKQVTRITPADRKQFAQDTKVLRNELDELKKLPAPTKGASKNKRKAYDDNQALIKSKKADLKGVRDRFKAKERFAKRNRDRANAMKTKNLDAFPRSAFDSVNLEVAKRVEIVDATYAARNQQIAQGKLELNRTITENLQKTKEITESPTMLRTYRPEAEEKMRTVGARLTEQAEVVRQMDELANATAIAKEMMESKGIKYDVDMKVKQLKTQVEHMKKANEKLSICLAGAS